ncbi:MAG: NAD-binding protein [Bacteroidales bacterium]|nr:NAD-binding protein [Bacteroidales bacterium]
MKDNSSDSGRQFYIPVILTVITIFLGLISFQAVFPDYPFLRKLYYTLQLFTLESGDRFYEKGPQPLWIDIIFNLSRFLAIIALIVTIILAILSVIQYRFFIFRLRWKKNHTILCGLGGIGEAYADTIKEKRKLVIIEKNTANENLSKLKKEGAVILEANALDPEVLRKVDLPKASCLLAITGDDFDNLTIIDNALALVNMKIQNKIIERVLALIYKIFRKKRKNTHNVSLIANVSSRNLKAAVTREWQYRPDCLQCDLKTTVGNFYNVAKVLAGIGTKDENYKSERAKYDTLKTTLLGYNPVRASCDVNMRNIRLFNINQLAGRYIFLNFPPDRFRRMNEPSNSEMKILFLGFSNIGEELLKLCFQNCHHINSKKTRITLVAIDGNELNERIRSKYKNIDNLIELNVINQNPHHMTFSFLDENDIKNPDMIYISSAEDRFQASYSSKARELFGEDVPIIRPFYRKNVLCRTEVNGKTHSFNIFSKVACKEYLVDELLDRRAVMVHNRWILQAITDYIDKVDKSLASGKEIPEPKPTLAPWHLLDEEYREDNRSVVDHINIKLRSVFTSDGLPFFVDPASIKLNFEFLKNASIIDHLADMEHRRWMANKFLCGWVFDEQRNDSEKKHNCLKDFYELDETTKDYDRQQVKEMPEIIGLK